MPAHPTSPPCCKAFLLQGGTLKHIQCTVAQLFLIYCVRAVLHFILQLAAMPLQEDTAKSPRSGHTATEMKHTWIITHTHPVLPTLVVILLCSCPTAGCLFRLPSPAQSEVFSPHCYLFYHFCIFLFNVNFAILFPADFSGLYQISKEDVSYLKA